MSSTMEGLLRSVSSAISDRFYSFFSLTSAVLPEENEESDVEDCDVSLDSETDGEVGEELQARLGPLYGEATGSACHQARQLLLRHFAGNVGRFLTEFLTPSVALLESVRQQVCDSSETAVPSTSPATATTSANADTTTTAAADDICWPFAYHDSVLLHLCDVTPLAHLDRDGDFFFCLQLASQPDSAEKVPDSAEKVPSLVVKLRTRDEVREFPVGEGEFRAAFSTMDWVTQAKGAPDHELSYILRQCLIATEYTVRHLQWEETLQERGTGTHPRVGGGGGGGAPGAPSPSPGTHSHGPGVVHSQGHGVPSHGCSQGHGGGAPSREQRGVAPQEGEGGVLSPGRRGVPSPGHEGGVPSQGHRGGALSQVHEGGVPSPGHGEGVPSRGHGEGVPAQGPSQKPGLPPSRSSGHSHSQGSPSQHSPNSSSPDCTRGPSRLGVHESGGSDSDSTLVSDDSFRRTSGSADGGGGGGGADTDGDRSCDSVSDGGGAGDGQRNGDASPAERCASRGSPSAAKEVSPTVRHNSSYYTHRHVAPPNSVSDLDYHLLHSGIAILPGCSDLSGKRLIFIFTCSVLWHHRQVASTELTRLLMYYYSVPRRELVAKGLTIVVDIRGATSSTVNILLESLYLFTDNVPNSVSVIHMLADKPTQSLVLKSPVYDPQSRVSMDVLLSQDLLLRSISVDQLPPALDGSYPYSHEEWVRFRMKLEPFLTNCCTVAQFLVGVMQEVSSSDFLPRTSAATRLLLQRHQQQVQAAFNDPRLLAIQNDGEAIMSSLRRDETVCCHSEDYRHALEKVSHLYRQLQETMARLAHLADKRLQRLEQCLQLRGFEEECEKVLRWLQQDGQSLLERHSHTADNLKAVKGQQRDFEKLYFSAMTHIEKGHDLMEEAGTLSQTAAFSESALGYKDGARQLQKQLQLFTAQLEGTRERIEGTARCYSLLDKSYEWALEAMKYVASMRMEHCASAPGLDKLLRSLEHYLQHHPPMSDDTFHHMMDMAQRLHNDKLLEQCRLAKTRCQETYQLLLLRQNTLQRARDQLAAEQGVDNLGDVLEDCGPEASNGDGGAEAAVPSSGGDKAASLSRGVAATSAVKSPVGVTSSSSPALPAVATDLKSVAEEEDEDFPVWEPRTTSTPTREEDWSDAYGLNRCRPPSSSSASAHYGLKEGGVESSFSDSPHLTTRDRSATVIANPMTAKMTTPSSASSPSPTSPSSRLPGRPAPLDSPRRDKPEFKTPAGKGPARLQLSRTISQPATSLVSKLTALASPAAAKPGPLKKILKRASTAPVPMVTSPVIYEDPEAGARAGEADGKREQRDNKTLSMITGSSESLPSMPEEDEEFQEDSLNNTEGSGNGSKIKWTPLSVNSHLHHSRATPTENMADLRLSGSRRTVLLIMSEMVQTERDYTRSLQYIIENYIPELQRVDVPQLMRGKRNVIFGNVEKIYQFHSQYFLRELEACEHNPFLVGHYFLRHEADFHLYTLYNKNKPKSDDLMMELGKQFFRQKQLELGDRMDLASYLLKPVQRMGKYALLLKQILKECPETEPEYADLKAAEEMVRFQLRHGNDLLAMDSLREVDVNLQEQGKLLRQDEFLVFQGRKKMMRQVFLFEDLILFSKTRRGRQGQHDIYVYKHSIKMADIGLTENCGDSGYKFEIWFRRRSLGGNYIMQAPNSEVKRAWVREISRILWHQAIRNRESHINEMASMGIGNKPCMDIQPSRDNIQNRALDIPFSGRGARTRNSIAVSSMEYLRNGTKRPHSIISVSSNSSSNSSHSSVGLFGSLNLAFDPIDSPRHLHRQSMMSSESGIETDHSTGDGDPGGGKPGQQQQTTPTSPDRAYPGVLQPRVLNQSFTEPIMTDV